MVLVLQALKEQLEVQARPVQLVQLVVLEPLVKQVNLVRQELKETLAQLVLLAQLVELVQLAPLV